jgi:hypothetical protein
MHACKRLSPSCAIQEDLESPHMVPQHHSPQMVPQHQYIKELLKLMCSLYACYVHLLENVIDCSLLWVYFMYVMQRAAKTWKEPCDCSWHVSAQERCLHWNQPAHIRLWWIILLLMQKTNNISFLSLHIWNIPYCESCCLFFVLNPITHTNMYACNSNIHLNFVSMWGFYGGKCSESALLGCESMFT